MKKQTPIRKRPNAGPRPHKAQAKSVAGRVDILAVRLLEQMVYTKGNPMIAQLFAQTRPIIEQELAARVGPRTKRGKLIRELIEHIATNHPLTSGTGGGAQ